MDTFINKNFLLMILVSMGKMANTRWKGEEEQETGNEGMGATGKPSLGPIRKGYLEYLVCKE